VTAALPNLANRLRGHRGVLVDSNILLDVATNDIKWSDWSERALGECASHAALMINPIIYAEVSIGFTSIEALDAALPALSYASEALPWGSGIPGREMLSGVSQGRRRAQCAAARLLHRGARCD
jgi:hypothetical protein